MTKVVGTEPDGLPPYEYNEWPKWVVPHASHIDAKGRGLGFHGEHKDRAGNLSVLVHDQGEEEQALSPKVVPVVEAE